MPLQTVECLPSSGLIMFHSAPEILSPPISSACESTVGFCSLHTTKSFVKNQAETNIICSLCGFGLASLGVVGHGVLRYTLTNNE